MSAKVANKLATEKSPYLLQHAYNPVDWYPWGKQAFEASRSQNKPIFLSVGYSTCHWCHVMEHESFENQEIADLMNKSYINIKVDREERPNVDRLFMLFVQSTTGHGGWPMSVFLTPQLKPFFGGTYFPPSDKHGTPGFPSILDRVSTLWQTNSESLISSSDEIIKELTKHVSTIPTESEQSFDSFKSSHSLVSHYSTRFDSENGGFSKSPKFPTPVVLEFLLRYNTLIKIPNDLDQLTDEQTEHLCKLYSIPHSTDSKKELNELESKSNEALKMAEFTLIKISKGGIHDHIGGGFHRYSVDPTWHIPHFEKMLYDQAQLLSVYSHLLQTTGNSEYEVICNDIISFVCLKFIGNEGGFFSALDADSLPTYNDSVKKEGAFAVWEYDEIVGVLGDNFITKLFCFHFGVEKDGNVHIKYDPQGELENKNILIQKYPVSETSKKFNLTDEETLDILSSCRVKLLSKRDQRPSPHLDDKIITSWNGLMISSLCKASQVMRSEKLVLIAAKSVSFIYKNMYDENCAILCRSYRGEPSSVWGVAEDYSFLIDGLLSLYQCTFDQKWIKWAVDLQSTMDKLFWDKENGGYFDGIKDENLVLRLKQDQDGAEPTSNSIAIGNLLKLYAITENQLYLQKAEQLMTYFQSTLSNHPQTMPMFVANQMLFVKGIEKVIIHGQLFEKQVRKVIDHLYKTQIPNRVLVHVDPSLSESFLKTMSPTFKSISEKTLEEKKIGLYFCNKSECEEPLTMMWQIRKRLGIPEPIQNEENKE